MKKAQTRPRGAVDQGFRYAINLKCDWVIVTNLKEIRLYHKGNDYAHFERFETALLADEDVHRDKTNPVLIEFVALDDPRTRLE